MVWRQEEKEYFANVIKEDDEELVIWAIEYSGSGVRGAYAIEQLASEYDTIDHIAGKLWRTPEMLRPA